MTIGTKIFTRFHGQHVGTDELGNKYYVDKKAKAGQRARRWVMYAGAADPSSVPPEWHGWLHYTTDVTPADAPPPHYAWQKPAKPNLSGTSAAYLPDGHLLSKGQRQKNVADYEPWQPQ